MKIGTGELYTLIYTLTKYTFIWFFFSQIRYHVIGENVIVLFLQLCSECRERESDWENNQVRRRECVSREGSKGCFYQKSPLNDFSF